MSEPTNASPDGVRSGELDLDSIEARLDLLPDGPWLVAPEDWERVVQVDGEWVADVAMGSTAEFIAHARDDVPALVAEVRRLRAATDAEVLLSHTVVDWAAEAIEQAQVRGRVRVAHRLGRQGRQSLARAVLDVARAALAATAPVP